MSKKQGFTMVELMIVMVIVGILGAFAIPSYRAHVVKTRRAEGQVALVQAASAMERYYSQNSTFTGATIATLGLPASTENGYYDLVISSAADTAYLLEADPQGDQATHDTDCGSLGLNQLGQKGVIDGGSLTVNLDCW